MKKISYRKGYKYQLAHDYQYQISIGSIRPTSDIYTEFIDLTCEGLLTIRAGYAWDGPSGPTIDTKNFMRGSLVHDALYQLMRQKHLPLTERPRADIILRDICLEDGMSGLRAWYVHRAVSRYAFSAADPKHEKQTYIAP
jgi:hypothetical protein